MIVAIDNNKTAFNSPPFTPFISERLRELIKVPGPIDQKKSINEQQQQIENKVEQTVDTKLKKMIRDELEQTKNELKKDIQELLNNFIKNSNANKNIKDKINE